MSRSRSAEQARGKSKNAIAVEELTRGIEKFQELLGQVEDLSREGFPYRDAVRARAELHIRDSIRRIFGEKSSEYQTYKTHKLRTNNQAEMAHSIALLKELIASLENRKLGLLGMKPPSPSAPEAPPHQQPAQARPQLSLVPPITAPAQVTITPIAGTTTPVTPAPITMSVALTTNLGASPTPVTNQPPPSPDPVPSAAEVQAISPATTPTPRPASTPATPPAQPPLKTEQALHSQNQSSPQHSASPSSQVASPLPSTATTPTWETNDNPPISTPAPADSSKPRTKPPSPEPGNGGSTDLSMRGNANEDLPIPKLRGEASPAPVRHTRSESDLIAQVRTLCSRFHAVVRQLRLRREYRATLEVEDEYDVQDLLHALLRLEFEEIEIEDWTPSYTQGGSRTTFLLANNTIAVVVKKTRPGLGGREIAEQLQIDSERYAARKNCRTLFCFVYDPEGRIGNPRGFESDLTSVSDRYTVEVLVAPK